jgi:hypothetical protein
MENGARGELRQRRAAPTMETRQHDMCSPQALRFSIEMSGAGARVGALARWRARSVVELVAAWRWSKVKRLIAPCVVCRAVSLRLASRSLVRPVRVVSARLPRGAWRDYMWGSVFGTRAARAFAWPLRLLELGITQTGQATQTRSQPSARSALRPPWRRSLAPPLSRSRPRSRSPGGPGPRRQYQVISPNYWVISPDIGSEQGAPQGHASACHSVGMVGRGSWRGQARARRGQLPAQARPTWPNARSGRS